MKSGIRLVEIILGIILVVMLAGTVNAERLVLSKPSELPLEIVFENHQYKAVVTEYTDPDSKEKGVYAKVTGTKVISFSCAGTQIGLANRLVKDGYVSTTNYGKIKIGLFDSPPDTIRAWLNPGQLKALKALKNQN